MFTGALSQTARTQDRIVDAARALLATAGLAGFSMRAVAERVERVVELGFEQFERKLLEAIVSLPVGSFARIAALGDAYIRFAAEHEEEFKILFNPVVTGRKRVKDLPGQGGYAILRRCIVEAMEHGALKESDPDLVAFYLWSRVHGIVMLLLACDFGDEFDVEGGPEAAELFDATRVYVTAGLNARE
jgi:AcrR family transcriptional regulator